MKHLTDEQLNEYLDNTLGSPLTGPISAHLSSCSGCQARLTSLQTVFQALAALPEVNPGRDLTPSVMRVLPGSLSGLVWRLVLACEAGLSIGLLVLLAPPVPYRLVGMMHGLGQQVGKLNLKLPDPGELHFTLPVIQLPHLSEPSLPVAITHFNSPLWFILGISALLLFVVGNFSLLFHNSSQDKSG